MICVWFLFCWRITNLTDLKNNLQNYANSRIFINISTRLRMSKWISWGSRKNDLKLISHCWRSFEQLKFINCVPIIVNFDDHQVDDFGREFNRQIALIDINTTRSPSHVCLVCIRFLSLRTPFRMSVGSSANLLQLWIWKSQWI